MSTYTSVYLEPVKMECEQYTDAYGNKRFRKKGILNITSFQNFPSFDDLVRSVGGVVRAPNPRYDPDGVSTGIHSQFSVEAQEYRGYLFA